MLEIRNAELAEQSRLLLPMGGRDDLGCLSMFWSLWEGFFLL